MTHFSLGWVDIFFKKFSLETLEVLTQIYPNSSTNVLASRMASLKGQEPLYQNIYRATSSDYQNVPRADSPE